MVFSTELCMFLLKYKEVGKFKAIAVIHLRRRRVEALRDKQLKIMKIF